MPIYIADATALREFGVCVSLDLVDDLWEGLTDAVEGGQLGFPRDVVKDLSVIARGEGIHGWAAGLGSRLNAYAPAIRFNRPLMARVADLGYREGFQSLDGKEPGVAHVARLAVQYETSQTDFIVVSEDLGEGPINPTMAQLCEYSEWPLIGARDCLEDLGLGHLL